MIILIFIYYKINFNFILEHLIMACFNLDYFIFLIFNIIEISKIIFSLNKAYG